MKRIIAILSACALLWASGGAFAQTKRTKLDEKFSLNQTEAVSLGSSHEMLIAPLTAVVRVDTTRAYFNGTYKLIIDPSGRNKGFETVEAIQAQALFDFTQQEHADMIVCSLCSLKTVDDEPEVNGEIYIYTLEVQMQGYPGHYTGFRPATEADKWIKYMYGMGQMKGGDSHIYQYVNKVTEDNTSGDKSSGKK